MDKNLANFNGLPSQYLTYEEAMKSRDEVVWQQLAKHSVLEALQIWLTTLSPLTRKNYMSGMNELIRRSLIDPEINLQSFSLINHNSIIDTIKNQEDWSEATRQARVASFISFIRYLSRKSNGMIKRAIPSREGNNKTFFKIREKVKTCALNHSEWARFLQALESINKRDALIAKIALQGGKRIQEVLSLMCTQINYDQRTIRFKQSKTGGLHKETLIYYPQSIMQSLREYINNREGIVFLSRYGKPIELKQLHNTFHRASNKAKMPFKVTPHVLRASAITYLKDQGFADSEIMKVTGHSSAEMVNAYDKRPLEKNLTKNIHLVKSRVYQ